jgi:hypothetical protein
VSVTPLCGVNYETLDVHMNRHIQQADNPRTARK